MYYTLRESDGHVRLTLSPDDLRAASGRDLGASRWLAVDQAAIDAFAVSTGDRQWIHVDPERARRESPYGATIAHGYLLLSITPLLADDVFGVGDAALGINYGLDRVRFLAPVPAGSPVRLRVVVNEAREVPRGVLAEFGYTLEREGSERPAFVATKLSLYVPTS
jgi:acyl dehydratase